jgi:hypothetical protein
MEALHDSINLSDHRLTGRASSHYIHVAQYIFYDIKYILNTQNPLHVRWSTKPRPYI